MTSGPRMTDGRAARAVIFDVYNTLLRVEPGPADAAARWERLCQETVFQAGVSAGLPKKSDPIGAAQQAAAEEAPTLVEFGVACCHEIACDHTAKKTAGVRWPEVDWRVITRRAWPALTALSEEGLDAFLAAHAALKRQCSAMPGALEFLETVRQSGALAGIASNAQNYTLHELKCSGIEVGKWFDDDLCFWSGREGFSKPDPGVFRSLTMRLAARGIAGEETLMIGDRLDNDILPAHAEGWKTWHFRGEWPCVLKAGTR